MSKIKSFEALYETVQASVVITFDQLNANPDQFADWTNCGDKGLPFEFFDGEVFTLPEKEKIHVWGREETINKKKYKMLYTAIHSDRQGFIEVPISIFRRIPSLKEEQELLRNEEANPLGAPLLNRMNDLQRIEMLSALAGTNPIVVREIVLHQNDFDASGKVIKDDPTKPEGERRKLVCHKFALAA